MLHQLDEPVLQKPNLSMNIMFSSSLLFLVLFMIILFPFADSIKFKKTRFDPNDPEIVYQGDAAPNSAGAIELNRAELLVRVGWAAYSGKVRIWDSESGKLSDFSTRFSFNVDTQGRDLFGDGFSFFLAPVHSQMVPNSAGLYLGLYNTTTSSYSTPNQIVHVEFDSVINPQCDPQYQHVGINVNSLSSLVTVPWNVSLHSGDTGEAWITYNGSTKILKVSWEYEVNLTPRQNSSISRQVDLSKVLPEWAMVGFSGASGLVTERHVIESWEFSSSLDVKETGGENAKRRRLITTICLSVSGLVLIAMGVAGILVFQRRNRIRRKEAEEKKMNLTSMINDDLERGAGPRRFLHRDLVSATNNFSNGRKLGEGGFGAVYKGYLVDTDMAIAVKKISRGSKQGRKEYVTEVKVFSRLRHRNLVQLIGWCHDNGELLLVYEYMPNGSLDAHLFGKKSPLSWAVRYKVALGLASALLYLHEEWEQCVVHRDIKASNIMLDSSFNVKLGDFGLARLMDHELGPQTTGVAGTFGYMAPEYVSTGRASKESDVFSFGVVALEIATGRKSVDPIEANSEVSLVEWIWDLYGGKKLHLAVDKKLRQLGFDEKQLECLMIVGLWCAHPDHNLRPSIRQAMQVLGFEAQKPDLPEKMPALMYHAPMSPATTLENSGEVFMSNSSINSGR